MVAGQKDSDKDCFFSVWDNNGFIIPVKIKTKINLIRNGIA